MLLQILALMSVKISTPDTYHPHLASVLVNASNTYFKEHTRLIFDLTSGNNTDFLTGLLQGHNKPVKIFKTPLKNFPNLKGDMIIILDERIELNKLRWNPEGRVLVIARGNDQLALNISWEIWRLGRTINVVTAMIEGKTIEFYSWLPYRPTQCAQVQTVSLIDEWREESGFRKNANLYQHQILKNLNECPFVAIVFPGAPYVTDDFKSGIDIEIFQILSNHFNFKLIVNALPETENFFLPKIRNGSGFQYHGAMRVLNSYEADVAIPSTTAQIDRFEASLPLYPHEMEKIVWVVPSPIKISPVGNIFRVFTSTLWSLILSTVIALVFPIYASHLVAKPRKGRSSRRKRKSRGIGSAIFYTFVATITGQTTYKAISGNLRFATTLIFVLSMHFMIAYQSSLIHLLTVPSLGKPFENVQELHKAGLACLSYSAGLRPLMAARNEDKNMPICQNLDIPQRTETAERIAYQRDRFLLYPQTIAYYMTSDQYEDRRGRDLIMQLPVPFMVLPVSYYMSPGNILAQPFSDKIQQMVEHGIVRLWYVRTKNMHVMHQVLSKPFEANADEDKQSVLTVEHLQGAFLLHVAILIFTFFVFLMEILVNRVFSPHKPRLRTK